MPAMTKILARRWHLGFLAASVLATSSPATAATGLYVNNGGGDYSIKLGKTFADRRFNQVVRQRYDFSCGSAAVATLLTHHYDHPTDEMSVLSAMYAQGNQGKIRREGFSLLDMKLYLTSIGYNAEGYRESLDKLSKVKVPAIVLINKRGFMHFVVIKGVSPDKVSVGDPTLGMSIYDRKEFEKMWNGILFVVTTEPSRGHASFNLISAWKPYGIPRFGEALDNGQLSSLTMNSYTPNYY